MGNPSDGFNGKTISMSIANFWADVTIKESDTLVSHTSCPVYTREMVLGSRWPCKSNIAFDLYSVVDCLNYTAC